MNLLAAAAVGAAGEVAFVIAPHLGREAGNVIPPARQNLSYDWIDALLTHEANTNTTCQSCRRITYSQANRLHCLGLGRQKHPVVEQSPSRGQRFFRHSPRYFRMIVLL